MVKAWYEILAKIHSEIKSTTGLYTLRRKYNRLIPLHVGLQFADINDVNMLKLKASCTEKCSDL
jgi:hypothetical protein